jgi:hypothetical protein
VYLSVYIFICFEISKTVIVTLVYLGEPDNQQVKDKIVKDQQGK